MPLYTLVCDSCEYETEEMHSIHADKFGSCPKCGLPLKKAVDCTHFKLITDNKTQSCGWAYNNYDHNCYWDDIKKQKAEGKDVKPITEA